MESVPAESPLLWHIQTIEIILPRTWALHSSNDPALLSPSLQLQTTSNIDYVEIFRGCDADGQFSLLRTYWKQKPAQTGAVQLLCHVPLQNSVERKSRSFNISSCTYTIKYTIRSIVCEASCHPVIQVIQVKWVIRVISTLLLTHELSNTQHQNLQVCFADKEYSTILKPKA